MPAYKRKRNVYVHKGYGPEHELQKAFFEWLHLTYPLINKVTFAVPNGVRCSQMQAMKLKAEGLKAGMPDVMMAKPNDTYSGLFIEFKIKPNKPSEIQTEKMLNLTENGYKCVLVYDIDDAMNVVKEYLTHQTSII